MGALVALFVFLFAMIMLGAAAEAREERRRLRIRGVRIAEPRRVVRTRLARYHVSLPSRTDKAGRGTR